MEYFEFNQNSAIYFNDSIIHGDLLSFIIPPNGILNILYETIKDTYKKVTNFNDYTIGIIQVNFSFLCVIKGELEDATSSERKIFFSNFCKKTPL